MRKEGQPIHSKCILVHCSTPGVFEESLSTPPPTERILHSAFKIPKGGMKSSLSIEDRNGALFTEDQRDSPSELAFKYSIYRINKDKTLLANTTLVYDIQHVPKDDSFHAAKKGRGPPHLALLYFSL
ncbi:uncharacterized protein CDAR_173211 [Caerostris darwini]|uniref:Uncharacterized protein n=1 Tax=Caerostris darwini TaxID=1538125 RepID=A0AAV4WHQ6_9ARAC|nr:uncharacterized protein CDAR_173211 [Caerostris darwini]